MQFVKEVSELCGWLTEKTAVYIQFHHLSGQQCPQLRCSVTDYFKCQTGFAEDSNGCMTCNCTGMSVHVV